jgi:hypothetical protein
MVFPPAISAPLIPMGTTFATLGTFSSSSFTREKLWMASTSASPPMFP